MDIIIYDDEFTKFGDSIKSFGEQLEGIFDRYVECMEKLGKEAITSGNTSDNINYFVNSISILKGNLASVSDCIKSTCDNYITDIDEADDFLF